MYMAGSWLRHCKFSIKKNNFMNRSLGADDKQVELITPNSQSQAIVSFEIKYPYFQLEKADVAVFMVVNGDTKHSLSPINFVSHCAFFIKIDSLSFSHDGFYKSIITDKRTGHVLQDSIKQLDVKGMI